MRSSSTSTERKIVPAELIRLLPDKVDGVVMDEIDAEGVAYVEFAAPGEQPFFYVIGSHGLSRMGALQPSRFFLLRFPVDPATGRPTFAIRRRRGRPGGRADAAVARDDQECGGPDGRTPSSGSIATE